MKFGISLGAVNPKVWVDVAVEADRLGFESVWLPEHVVVPMASEGSPHHGADHPPVPSNIPIFDALVYFAHIAAKTSRVRLGTQVYNIGLRHPFLTARAATTLDIVSDGRLDLGIGASWLEAEWKAMGLDFATRGARVDEAIDVCRRLWTEDVIEHHGTHFDFGPTAFEPKPVQPGGPRLHIGGDGPAALRRAATIGAGWLPMNHAIDDLPRSLDRLAELSARAGRAEPVELTIAASVTTVEDVDRYAAAGVDRLIVRPWSRTSEAIEGMGRFADEVLSLEGVA